MEKLHQKKGPGTEFLIEPLDGIKTINGIPVIMTRYYGKTLKHYRNNIWNGLEKPIKQLTYGLLQGLQKMHCNQVAHRDIKADNILLKNAEGDPVIIDYGLANAKELGSGTPGYLAPE